MMSKYGYLYIKQYKSNGHVFDDIYGIFSEIIKSDGCMLTDAFRDKILRHQIRLNHSMSGHLNF